MPLMKRPDALRLTGKQIQQLELLRGDSAFDHYPPQAKRGAVEGVVVVDITDPTLPIVAQIDTLGIAWLLLLNSRNVFPSISSSVLL